jgi:hypothetical protein
MATFKAMQPSSFFARMWRGTLTATGLSSEQIKQNIHSRKKIQEAASSLDQLWLLPYIPPSLNPWTGLLIKSLPRRGGDAAAAQEYW